ncbi:hypothetical protein C8Q73DRAFT_313604 [Cubamyces lactineus]|nr:hypothetical protein C8Q73DRAFT_313604 [Cubamyces lactineus]
MPNIMLNNNVFNATDLGMPHLNSSGSLDALDNPHLSGAEAPPPGDAGYPLISVATTPSFSEFVLSKEASMLLMDVYVAQYGLGGLVASVNSTYNGTVLGALTQHEQLAPDPPDSSTQPYPVLPPGAQYPPFHGSIVMDVVPDPPAALVGASHAPVAFDTSAGNSGFLDGGAPVAPDPTGGSISPPLFGAREPYASCHIPPSTHCPPTLADTGHGAETMQAQHSLGLGAGGVPSPGGQLWTSGIVHPYSLGIPQCSDALLSSSVHPLPSLSLSAPGEVHGYPVMSSPDSAASLFSSSSPSASASAFASSTFAPSPSFSPDPPSALHSPPVVESSSLDLSDVEFEKPRWIHNRLYRIPTRVDSHNVKWYLCTHPGCNRSIRTRRSNLIAHITERHGPNGRNPWRCDCCWKAFSRERDLKRHKKQDHSLVNPAH